MRECRRELAKRGSSVLLEVTKGLVRVPEWHRYPEGEVYDPVSHAQYFYHRHAAEARGGPPALREHGHFHLFLRAEGMPPGTAPLLVPEQAVANAPVPPQSAPLKHGMRDEVAHLIAIAIDERGEPIRLFTTNRWVTGETWYAADDMIRMLDRFELRIEAPSPLLNCWLVALVRLFQPEIAVLLRKRDKQVQEWQWRWGRRGHAFEDARLEIASSIEIDLDARLAAIEAVDAKPPPLGAVNGSIRPPRLAEGWGA